MQFFLTKIDRLRFDWNRKTLSENDFYKLCRRFRITVVEMPLRTNGFYYCVKGRHFIAVDSKLPKLQKLFVMFHEFAHFLMHAPDSGVTASFYGIGGPSRKEAEADAFALCALIPIERLAAQTLHEWVDEGFPAEMIAKRRRVFERYGI